jgi:hypothetical protein
MLPPEPGADMRRRVDRLVVPLKSVGVNSGAAGAEFSFPAASQQAISHPVIRIAAKIVLVRFTLQPLVALLDLVSLIKVGKIRTAFWSNPPRHCQGIGARPSRLTIANAENALTNR